MSNQWPMPQVFVINLDHREDRWKQISETCSKIGVQPTRISAIQTKPGSHGCGKSHQKAVQLAKDQGLPWVLVLEDDATIELEDWNRFLSYLPTLWRRMGEWNIFTGGPHYIACIRVFDRETQLAQARALSSHFMLYSHTFYDTLLSWTVKNGPIDCWLSHNHSVVFGYPHIAYQADGYSDITQSVFKDPCKGACIELGLKKWPVLFPELYQNNQLDAAK